MRRHSNRESDCQCPPQESACQDDPVPQTVRGVYAQLVTLPYFLKQGDFEKPSF